MAERKSKSPGEATGAEQVKPVTLETPEPPTGEVTPTPKGAAPSSAAPLEAPVKRSRTAPPAPQMEAAGATAPQAAMNDLAVRLFTADGAELRIEDVFEYPSMANPGALVRVNQRVYRESSHRGAKTKTTQLMYPEGALISIFEAERVKAELASLDTDTPIMRE